MWPTPLLLWAKFEDSTQVGIFIIMKSLITMSWISTVEQNTNRGMMRLSCAVSYQKFRPSPGPPRQTLVTYFISIGEQPTEQCVAYKANLNFTFCYDSE